MRYENARTLWRKEMRGASAQPIYIQQRCHGRRVNGVFGCGIEGQISSTCSVGGAVFSYLFDPRLPVVTQRLQVKVSSKGLVALPKQIRDKFEIDKGDHLTVSAEGGKACFRR